MPDPILVCHLQRWVSLVLLNFYRHGLSNDNEVNAVAFGLIHIQTEYNCNDWKTIQLIESGFVIYS